MKPLIEYLVHYDMENEELIFRCWAEDEDHAIEQCKNAEPSCVIVLVERR